MHLFVIHNGSQKINFQHMNSTLSITKYICSIPNHTCINHTIKTPEQPIYIVFCKWKYELESMNVFVVINFDALAQAGDIWILRRQVVFLCWMQDSNLEVSRHLFASRLNAHSQTEWSIEDQAKLELNSPSLWWVSIQPTWLHCLAFVWLSHLALAIYMFVVVNFDALAQASDTRI